MPAFNQHWYNGNEGVSYPIADSATALDDAGVRLPSSIIVDVSLRWPLALGRVAFVSAVAVTKALVTVVLQSAADEDAPGFSPLASVSVVQPADEGRLLTLSAQVAGVGGWIVFGSGVRDRVPYHGRFSTPAQSRLAPRAARAFGASPVSGLRVLGADGRLTGVVRLLAETPLEVVRGEREVDGIVRECAIIRLIDDVGLEGFPVPVQTPSLPGGPNVFKDFSGPCGGRPESGTCGDPQPIEFVGGVGPDCDGVLTLEFAGCATVSPLASAGCGVVLDCGLGLIDACLPDHLPSSAGLLPGAFDPADIPSPPPVPPPGPEDGESDVAIPAELPYRECFGDEDVGEFTAEHGAWAVNTSDDSPTLVCEDEFYGVSSSLPGESQSLSQAQRIGSYETTTTSTRNVTVVITPFGASRRRVTTEVKLLEGPVGAKHNGGLVLNYRDHVSVEGRKVYYLAEIDFDNQEFRIARFNGLSFQPTVPVSVPGLRLDAWYRIEAVIQPGSSPGQTDISARLLSITDAGAIDVTLTTTVSNYQPTTNGLFGLCTDHALARFAYLTVEEDA